MMEDLLQHIGFEADLRNCFSESSASLEKLGGKLILTFHWKGGVHTEVHLPRRRQGQHPHIARVD